MELKGLFVGLVFVLGAFGIKSGIGLSYFLHGKWHHLGKGLFLLLYASVYLVLFEACFYAVESIDLLKHLSSLQEIFKYAMMLHLLIAGGLIIWGLALLKREPKRTYAWLAMTIPCPVFVSVVFITTAFILSYFPHHAHRVIVGAYIVFIALVVSTIVSMHLLPMKNPISRNRNIALAMILVASYFILSVIIIPQFQELDKVYRLAIYRGGEEGLGPGQWALAATVVSVSFCIGFLRARRKLKRSFR